MTEKGLVDDARKALEDVTAKVAEAHGFDLNATEELSEDELEAVAGGDKDFCASCTAGKCGDCVEF
ncbi:MAG: hypothetical protein IJU48_00975 [Synergistaceae bacterium]|nr:hypothetical protein [Synergistaceae bacterium]